MRTLTKQRFAKTWEKLESSLSRQIYVYMADSERECPNCYYDKVNKRSSGVSKVTSENPNYFTVGRCPVCRGKGVLTTSIRRCIDAVVNWNPSENFMNSMTFTEAGTEGATRVEIKTDKCHLETIKNSKYVVIDNVRCKLSNPPIIRGLGDKHLLVAEFFTEYKPDPNSGETV